MSGAEVQGTFVWHEWMGRDPSAVASFYERVLGWRAQAPERDPSYTVWTTSRGAAAGAARLATDVQSSAVPPGWIAYVAVPDVEATTALAERLGGRILKGVTALPDGGRYAVVADPHSAVIGIYTPSPSGAEARGSDFVWHELATVDHSTAFRFYQELFGWERLGDHDLGALGTYLIFGRQDRQLGGLFSRRPGSVGAPHWVSYVEVPNAAHAAQAAVAAGGHVASAPHQVPGGSWVAHLTDPEGAAIAVHQARAAAGAAQSAPSAERGSSPAQKPKPAVRAPKPAPKPKSTAAPTSEAASRSPSARKVPAARKAAVKSSAAGRQAASGRSAPAKKRASATPKRRPAKKTRAKRAAGRAKTAKKSTAGRSAARVAARRKTAKPAARRTAVRAARKAAARRPVKRAARRKGARRRR